MQAAPESLRAFWSGLQRAELTHGGRMLQLEDTTFLGDSSLGDRMLVRECYPKLWEKLEEDFLAGSRGRVIIGTPGEEEGTLTAFVCRAVCKVSRVLCTPQVSGRACLGITCFGSGPVEGTE